MTPEDEKRMVEIARREAGRLVHDRRRHILKDYGGVPLEGRLAFTEYKGTAQASVDGLDLAAFLRFQGFKDGDRIQLLVMLDHWTAPEEEKTFVSPSPPEIDTMTHETVTFVVNASEPKDIAPVNIRHSRKPTKLQDGALRALDNLGGFGTPRQIYDLLESWTLMSVKKDNQVSYTMRLLSSMFSQEWVRREGKHGSLVVHLTPKGRDLLKTGSVL